MSRDGDVIASWDIRLIEFKFVNLGRVNRVARGVLQSCQIAPDEN
jgi:hypothetical protein